MFVDPSSSSLRSWLVQCGAVCNQSTWGDSNAVLWSRPSNPFLRCCSRGCRADQVEQRPQHLFLWKVASCRNTLCSYLSGTITFGKQWQCIAIYPFAFKDFPSGSRFFSSDSSISSIPSSGRKDNPTFDVLGDVDEINSALGLAHEYCAQAQLKSTLEEIEEIKSRLFDIGLAVAATPLNSLSPKKVARVKFNAATMGVLKNWIEKMDEELPHMSQFILPSGGLPVASLHVARSICRRAERKVVILVKEQVVDQSVARYLNRLSDFLLRAARYTALKLKKPETIWIINNRC